MTEKTDSVSDDSNGLGSFLNFLKENGINDFLDVDGLKKLIIGLDDGGLSQISVMIKKDGALSKKHPEHIATEIMLNGTSIMISKALDAIADLSGKHDDLDEKLLAIRKERLDLYNQVEELKNAMASAANVLAKIPSDEISAETNDTLMTISRDLMTKAKKSKTAGIKSKVIDIETGTGKA
jgi:hypothetical protein